MQNALPVATTRAETANKSVESARMDGRHVTKTADTARPVSLESSPLSVSKVRNLNLSFNGNVHCLRFRVRTRFQ
jgi:hypothetical protein